MIFRKKNIFIVLLLFIAFGLNLNATISEELEVFTAFLRIPAVMGANIVGYKNGVAPKGVAPKVMVIAADLIRTSNEILSIVNKRGKRDLHHYDYFWAAHDITSLVLHVEDLLENKVEADLSEFVKLDGMLQLLHETFLPVVEGVTACLASMNIDAAIVDQHFRLKCKSINSLVRMLDNLIVSKPKSYEQYAYVSLLCVNIMFALYDFLGVDWRPLFRLEADCIVCAEHFVAGDTVREHCCGHAVFHSKKECLGEFEGKAGSADRCPICRVVRDLGNERDVVLTQNHLENAKK